MSRSHPHPARDTGSHLGRRPPPHLGTLLVAAGALAGLSLSVASCKKDTESLVVVALTAAPDDTALDTVTITAGSVTQTFALPRGLSSTAISFGLYLPTGITGSIDVRATATAAGAAACAGYLGSTTTFVIAGGTSNADIALQPGNSCTTGPDGGTGGSSGHGSSPPSLAHCTEYGHDLDPAAACVTGDPNTDVVITDVAFSHSGKTLYTAGVDSRVKVWVWDEASLSLTAEGHELDTSGGFTYLAVSPDDKLVAAGSTGGRLTIWNVGGTWSIAGNLTGITGDIYGVAFSPDSKTLYAIDTDGNLTSYVGTVSPTIVTALNPMSVPFVLDASTTESDGSFWLGVGYNDGDASLLHVVGGSVGPEFPFTVSTGLSGIYTMRFSADGTLVESGTDDGSFGIWNVPLPAPADARSPPIAITTDWIYGAAFHPTGASIAIAAGGSDAARQLGIWTLATGAMKSAVSNSALSYRPTAVAFSPDGTTLVAGEHSCGKIIVCAD